MYFGIGREVGHHILKINVSFHEANPIIKGEGEALGSVFNIKEIYKQLTCKTMPARTCQRYNTEDDTNCHPI